MVQRIEYVHSKGYIYRDIKQGNFIMGKNFESNILFNFLEIIIKYIKL